MEPVFNDTEKQSAWEQSGKFEGDIMLSQEQLRTGLINPARRWPNRIVPFVMHGVFNGAERNRILLAIRDFHERTPIRFRQYNPQIDPDYIHITGENTGCWSYVGRQGGRQQLNLQRNGCVWHGIIIHELLHALGFLHMHSATDRDNYVIINWQNIESGRENNFFTYSASIITSFGVPYDYDSVMHYGPYAFSRNGLRTIQPRDPNAQIGQMDGFSDKDVERVIRMYENVNVPDNSSHATRSHFITFIIITLNICTHLQ
jgi:hypothetical protein